MARHVLVLLGGFALAACLLAAKPITTIDPTGFPKHSPEGGKNVVRIWHEKGSWFLRTSTEDSVGKKDRLIVFTGSVRSEDRMTVTGHKLEPKRDSYTMHADGKGFDFRFTTSGAQDTAEIKPGPRSKTLTFKLRVNGEPVEPSRIVIGADSKCPDKAEFTLPATPGK